MATFAAIDFETATGSRASACSVGVVLVDDDVVIQSEERLIQPPGNEYASFNVSLHGISARDTANSGRFEDVWPEMADLIGDRLVVAHNAAFDISVLRHSAEERGYDVPPIHFACSLRIAKETWLGRWSYRLNDLAEDLEIPLDHHDALSDANAAAELMLAALDYHGATSVDEVAEQLGFRLGEVTGDTYQGFSNAWR